MLVEMLRAAIVPLLGAKLVATVILLRRDRASWFRARWSAALWWTTKITPLIAVPALIVLARVEQHPVEARIYAALLAFVVVAVGIAMGRRPWRV